MLKALRTGKFFQHLSEGHVKKICNFHPWLQQKLCVQNTNSLCSKSHINASQNQTLRSPLSSILNAMIPLCEPASAQKTGLEHNVWYLVVQGDSAMYWLGYVCQRYGSLESRE